MPSSSKPSPIPNTSAIANSKNGSPTISILMSSTSIGCPKTSPNWLSPGRANPLSSAAVPPNPRCSTHGYVRGYLANLDLPDPDGHIETAELVWLHALAICYSPEYLSENEDGVKGDFPRIPLPATAEALQRSA